MNPLSILCLICLGTLPFALPAAASPVVLTCAGTASGHLGSDPVCGPLRALLDRRYASGTGPVVRLELVQDDTRRLAGRLVWQAAAGSAATTGPVVEVSARDHPLDARAGVRLANGLVRVSGLP
ncbi:MAG: hypothetical protein Q7J57_09310 [Gemmobacter sp.]|nr:hypothetical protein [Gemmobacter sp.]